jgi:hypothetical protein
MLSEPVTTERKEQPELDRLAQLVELLLRSPIPRKELLFNLHLYQRRQDLSRVLLLNELYQKVIPIHGYILEFGARYGASTATLMNLRGMYEPFNYSRRIVTFDTFEGFVGVDEERDAGDSRRWETGDYGVPQDYKAHLAEVLAIHESFSPIPQLTKHEICAGDVRETLPRFLERHPETLVALAYFDMDIYAPTKEALRLIKGRVQRGTVLVFDELCDQAFPGETMAVLEELDVPNLTFFRNSHQPTVAYCQL